MDDILNCQLETNALVSMCCEENSFLSVISEQKLSKNWMLLEEFDDHLVLKNDKNEVLFVRKNK